MLLETVRVISKRILVIDDEEDMRELATFALELNGEFAVTTASSGREGIAAARLSPPDAILLDWMMPETDGAATLRALKSDALTRGIPVIVLSASAHDSPAAEFSKLGARGALAKPFDPMTLAAAVAALLNAPGSSAL